MKQYKKHSTNNTKHSKYKYTYYQTPAHYNPPIHPPIHTPHTHTHIHTLQNKLKQPQYKKHSKRHSHNTIKYPQYKATLIRCSQATYIHCCFWVCNSFRTPLYLSPFFRNTTRAWNKGYVYMSTRLYRVTSQKTTSENWRFGRNFLTSR